jgi:hypothetical protein
MIRRANSRWRIFLALAIIAGAVFSLLTGASAQSVPTAINFQGRLTDAVNNPLTGSHSFVFEIYSALTGGTQLWTETQGAVTVTNGVLSAQLGSSTPLSAAVFANSAAYLQITVDGVTLSPRQRLITTPFAFNAQSLQGRDYTALSLSSKVK